MLNRNNYMPSEILSITTINDFIEGSLIPSLEKKYDVLNYKSVSNQVFFLVSCKENEKNDNMPSKFITAYRVEKYEHESGFSQAYIGNSYNPTLYKLVKCPNSLLSKIDKDFPEHKEFIMMCLNYQSTVEKKRLERPEKIEIIKNNLNILIKSERWGYLTFLRVKNARKGDFWGIRAEFNVEQIYNVDDFSLDELKKGFLR